MGGEYDAYTAGVGEEAYSSSKFSVFLALVAAGAMMGTPLPSLAANDAKLVLELGREDDDVNSPKPSSSLAFNSGKTEEIYGCCSGFWSQKSSFAADEKKSSGMLDEVEDDVVFTGANTETGDWEECAAGKTGLKGSWRDALTGSSGGLRKRDCEEEAEGEATGARSSREICAVTDATSAEEGTTSEGEREEASTRNS